MIPVDEEKEQYQKNQHHQYRYGETGLKNRQISPLEQGVFPFQKEIPVVATKTMN
ncbi:hypothetical protein SDC9_104834 [bioreactor metagenome]|uniref:Uncharacterized protein n=1 Tax=bioreactor metagenome TaxID=1076179 RepID=A0A645AXN4_9ZZZZ